MTEPSTSTHTFQRYIWEDFSVRRARNRAQSDQDKKDWDRAPEIPEEDNKPDYVIGPGEIRQQLLAQNYYGKGEGTKNRQNIKPNNAPKKKTTKNYTTPKEKEREKGFWPDEYAREDEILHVRSTYV